MKAFITMGILTGMVDVPDAKPEMLIPLPAQRSLVVGADGNAAPPKSEMLAFDYIGNTKIGGEDIAVYQYKGLKE